MFVVGVIIIFLVVVVAASLVRVSFLCVVLLETKERKVSGCDETRLSGEKSGFELIKRKNL